LSTIDTAAGDNFRRLAKLRIVTASVPAELARFELPLCRSILDVETGFPLHS
jgi:hypothetical protein